MDPDACLKELLELANFRHSTGFLLHSSDRQASAEVDADRMAELALSLDGWIRGGGFLPEEWQSKVSK